MVKKNGDDDGDGDGDGDDDDDGDGDGDGDDDDYWYGDGAGRISATGGFISACHQRQSRAQLNWTQQTIRC